MSSELRPPRVQSLNRSGGRLRRQGLRDCFVGLSAFCIPLTPQSDSRAANQEGGNQQQRKTNGPRGSGLTRSRVGRSAIGGIGGRLRPASSVWTPGGSSQS